VSTARTFLAEQESALLEAYLRTTIASDFLGQVIGTRPAVGSIFSCRDEPGDPAPVEPQDVVLARAYEANPTLNAARSDSAAAYHRAREAAWNAWPTLEAFGGYGASGLAGTGRQVVFGTDTLGTVYDTGFNEAWRQVTNGDYPDWNVGLRLVMPIGWRAERGNREVQAANYDRAREALRASQLALETRVLAAHRESEIAVRDRETVRQLVAAAEEQARIALLEYQSGRTTAYDLVNQEADLASARLRETEVRVRIMRAATELRRLTTPVPRRTTR
jgi:outer membrane protein TolC